VLKISTNIPSKIESVSSQVATLPIKLSLPYQKKRRWLAGCAKVNQEGVQDLQQYQGKP